jgi:hypothetical protein
MARNAMLEDGVPREEGRVCAGHGTRRMAQKRDAAGGTTLSDCGSEDATDSRRAVTNGSALVRCLMLAIRCGDGVIHVPSSSSRSIATQRHA